MYHAYRYTQNFSIHLYTAKYVNVYNMNTYTPIQANTLICTYAIHIIGPEIAYYPKQVGISVSASNVELVAQCCIFEGWN
jgi:hypothetical protein